MKKSALCFIVFIAFAAIGFGQRYEIMFHMTKNNDSILYIGQHYRDKYIIIDSAKRHNSDFVFKGKKALKKGIYALLDGSKQKSITDFTIDGTQKFTITIGESQHDIKVKGCPANTQMFNFITRNSAARKKANEINERKKSSDPSTQAQCDKELEALSNEMIAYEEQMMQQNKKYLFFQLQQQFNGPEVPDTIANKALYYRTHYWDGIDLHNHDLIYTPDLFNKMNYYFFGVLYHADADTICKYADMLLSKLDGDSLMMRYVLDYIMPKYYRSTKNIGWDQVWCYLVRHYYENHRCGFASQSEITSKVKQAQFLEKSLIGAYGAELFMADTNQSPNAEDWISSHRFPHKYVILWFWDPDCHHCQEQTATLITLYDSLSNAGKRNFEVYAVGYESDVEKWKNYVKEHHLPFVNVGGPNVNLDYQDAYNVHGAPTMIILNADRRIIMNKTLPTESIIPFLNDYEKKHPEQANQPLSRWQLMGRNTRNK